MILQALGAGLIEQAFEQMLALDGRHVELLAPIVDKHIVLDLTSPALRLHLVPTESSLRIHRHLDRRPDVVISGSWLAMARMKLGGSPKLALFSRDVHIDGDTEIAEHFQNLLEKLEMDWEGLVAGQVGSGLAGRLFGAASTGRQWMVDSMDNLRRDCSEYLQEEARALPAQTEAEQFYREVDDLRAGTDRLEARLQRLFNESSAES